MVEVIGVQFKGAGRIYFFNPLNIKFEAGDYVIVETVRGIELGKVILDNRQLDESTFETELKKILRKATEKDVMQDKKNMEDAKEAFAFFKKEVLRLDIDMKPLDAEYTFDRSKVILFYTAEDRVDFRDLLKHLTPHFKSRVELRQIGAREGARLIGGIGSCGREICCKSFIRNFDVVTMKMAKDQSMSLNTNKISGVCGKLMCCIAFENQLYQELKELVPSVGTYVKTPTCDYCKVIGVDYIKQIVRTQESPDSLPVSHYASEVEVVPRKN